MQPGGTTPCTRRYDARASAAAAEDPPRRPGVWRWRLMATSVGGWLASVKLERYSAAVADEGFDELEFLMAADETGVCVVL